MHFPRRLYAILLWGMVGSYVPVWKNNPMMSGSHHTWGKATSASTTTIVGGDQA